jgi:hypothetical protein
MSPPCVRPEDYIEFLTAAPEATGAVEPAAKAAIIRDAVRPCHAHPSIRFPTA